MTVRQDNPDELHAALQRVTRAAARHAQKSGLALQPDPALRRHVLRGLARHLLQHGRPYCPCREVTGEPGKDRPNICPCRTHRQEVARDGECECGLYVRDGLSAPSTGRE
jgi:ferredoxin-thioredoxin reductase catalytic subunit